MVRRWLALILGIVVLAGAPAAAQEQPVPTGAPSDDPGRDDAFDLDDLLAEDPPPPPADLGDTTTWEQEVDGFYDRYGDDMWNIPFEVEEEVLHLLFLEIALLDEVDGIARPIHPRVARIHAAYAPWPTVARSRYVDALFTVDDRLADLKNDIVGLLGEAPPQIAAALDEIQADQRDRIRGGESALVDSLPYMGAVSMFLSHGVSDEIVAAGDGGLEFELFFDDALFTLADPGDLDVVDDNGPPPGATAPTSDPDATPTTAAAAAARVADPAGAAGADAGDGGGIPAWAVVALIAGLGVAAGWAGGVLLRRRRQAGDDPRTTDLVLEAHRRLSAAREEVGIAATAAEFATRLTGASDALVLRCVPDGLRPAGQSEVYVHTVLDRVVETAQPQVGPVDADPLVSGPVEICAVPMVADARITGVLVARRPAGQPFSTGARRTLEKLAPAVAAALVGADELDNYEHLALVDGLTSLGNRRRLDGDLETAVSEAVGSHRPVAFAMIDVDHFKTFNDTHGHEAGDAALRTVARIIESTVRSDDIVYRYGGEEFSVLLPDATEQEAAQVVERIRVAVEAARIDGEETQPGGRLTVSVGLAQLDSEAPHELKRHADAALYEAKARGRNRCISA